jgi:hypothetical protein
MLNRLFKYSFLILAISASSCKKKTPETLETKVIEEIHKLNGSDKDPQTFAAPEGEPLYLYPPKLKLIKISADTVFLGVINDFYLTQSMGTAGAEEYITKAATSLLEINDIHYVDFDFKMGDHAYPGTYSKAGYQAREEQD